MTAQVLVATAVGDRFLVRVRGTEVRALVAKRRPTAAALRMLPGRERQATDEATFPIKVDDLLPRSLAHTTLDLYCDQGGRETRLSFPAGLRNEVISFDGIDLFPFRTAYGNLSLSLFRTDRRPPLRVTILVHQLNFSGGKTTFAFQLASVLRSVGFDVTIAALWLTSTPMTYQPPADVKLTYVDSQMLQDPGEPPLSLKMPDFSASDRTIAKIRAYFSGIDADVLYVPDYDSPLYDLILDSLPPRILSILGDHNPGRYGATLAAGSLPVAQPRNRLFYEAVQRFDAIHTINPVVLDAYRSSTPQPVFCIANSVDTGSGHSAQFLQHRRIVAAGRLVAGKNFHVLIRAFSGLRTQYPEWRLDIYGQGEEREALLTLIRDLRLDDVVTLSEPTPTLLDEMRSSSFHVSASAAEAFPLTMAEAMSVGLPVISHHRNAGAAYQLADGRGIIAGSTSVESLAEAMATLMRQIEAGDPDGTVRDMVALGMEFMRTISSRNPHFWQSQIVQLYDAKIEHLYARGVTSELVEHAAPKTR